jgi:hypothetical protein
MTATTTAIPTRSTVATAAVPQTKPLWRTGARAGLVAAAATTAVAAVALAASVPLEIDGEQIPLLGFAQMTLLCTALGVGIAKALVRWSARPRHRFVVTTMALTALSIVPDLAVNATASSKAVLITTHLVAAAIVIPRMADRLD